jgi:hypothetical protein
VRGAGSLVSEHAWRETYVNSLSAEGSRDPTGIERSPHQYGERIRWRSSHELLRRPRIGHQRVSLQLDDDS